MADEELLKMRVGRLPTEDKVAVLEARCGKHLMRVGLDEAGFRKFARQVQLAKRKMRSVGS